MGLILKANLSNYTESPVVINKTETPGLLGSELPVSTTLPVKPTSPGLDQLYAKNVQTIFNVDQSVKIYGKTYKTNQTFTKMAGLSFSNIYNDTNTYSARLSNNVSNFITDNLEVTEYTKLKYKENSLDEPFIVREIGQKWDLGISELPGWAGSLAYEVAGGSTTMVARSVADSIRFGKFLLSPRGIKFLAKQTALQLTNPKTESISASIFGVNLASLQENRIFNPAKLALNIPLAGIGGHVERHGLWPILMYENAIKLNDNGLNSNSKNIRAWRELGKDRMVSINSTAAEATSTAINIGNTLTGGLLGTAINSLGLGTFIGRIPALDVYDKQIILAYSGPNGPDSLYGIGATNIKTSRGGVNPNDLEGTVQKYGWAGVSGATTIIAYYDSNTWGTSDDEELRSKQRLTIYGNNTYNQPGAIDQKVPHSEVSTSPKKNTLTSFEIQKYNTYSDINKYFSDSTTAEQNSKEGTFAGNSNILSYIGTYNNYEKTAKPDFFGSIHDNTRLKYKTLGKTATSKGYNQTWNMHDRVGMPDINKIDQIYDINSNKYNNSEDFIKFYIGPYQFRCTTQGISDKFNPKWTEVEYIGRPESVRVYTGWSRDISFNFKIAATSRFELQGIYDKLDKLIGLTTPDIKVGRIVPPIIPIRLGKWLENIYGNITSLTYTIDDEYPWDIIVELPMYVNVDMSFQIISRTTPQQGAKFLDYNWTQNGKTSWYFVK